MISEALRALAPALLLLVVAGSVTALLHRIYDRVPAVVLAVFVGVTALLLGPVVAGGKLLVPFDGLRGQAPFQELEASDPHGNPVQGDLLLLVLPSQVEVRRALLGGEWPLWNSRVGAGMPLLADPQAQAFQPLTLAALPLPPEVGAGVTAALRVYFTLLFTFLLLRRLHLDSGAALVGALAWGLGGFLLLWLGWPLANSAVFLPAVLYGIVRCDECAGRKDVALAAAAFLGLLLAGHPETLFYVLVFAGLFLVARMRSRYGQPTSPGRAALLVAVAGAIAASAAAPVWVSTLDYLPDTLRFSRLGTPAADPPSQSAIERAQQRLLPVAVPNAFGNSRYASYWGANNSNEDASGFVGVAALLLAALCLGWRRERRRQERTAAVVAAGCLLILALPPGLRELLGALPGGTLSDYHHRLLLPLGFSLAWLAACELDRRASGEARRWPVIVGGLALAALVAWGSLGFPNPTRPDDLEVLRLGWLHWHLRFLVLAVILLLVGHGRRWLGWSIAPLVAAELLLAHGGAYPPMPQHLAFPEPEALVYLQENSSRSRATGLDGALPPNLASVYRFRDPRVFNPMAPAPYLDAVRPLIVGWDGEAPRFGNPSHPLYGRLGVRLLLGSSETSVAPPLKPVFESSAATVWERPALPFFFLSATGEEVPQSLKKWRLMPGSKVEREYGIIAGVGTQWLHHDLIGAAYVSREPGRLRTSLYQDGGWRLVLDDDRGRRRRIATDLQDGPFLAAWLPAGTGESHLREPYKRGFYAIYRPLAFLAGMMLAALGLTLGIAWLAGPAPVPQPRPKVENEA